MARDLNVLAWITESGWEACVDAVARLQPTEVTLLYVTTPELPGPPGRRHEEVMGRMAAFAEEAAQALLDDAVERLDDGTVTMYTLVDSGLPEDVASAITFLASPGAVGVTGTVLRVCGGAFVGA